MIFDLHNDFPTHFAAAEYDTYIESLDDNIVTAAIWTSELGENAESIVRNISALLSNSPRRLPLAIEDIGFLAHGDRHVDFDFSQFLYCSLTWNYNNGFAGGALDDGSLTESGRMVVRAINSAGCAVDLAHLNKKSFFQVLDRADRIVCSHTGFNSHKRSLDEEQIKALCVRNCVIGLCTVTAFSGASTACEFAEVIDRFVQHYGDGCLALGTDFNGSKDIPYDICDYSRLDVVADILRRKGYSADAVQNIFYNNANTFFGKER